MNMKTGRKLDRPSYLIIDKEVFATGSLLQQCDEQTKTKTKYKQCAAILEQPDGNSDWLKEADDFLENDKKRQKRQRGGKNNRSKTGGIRAIEPFF